MKKFTIPALISILFLTSCSQALYKDKYDWVKVAPAATPPAKTDTLVRRAETMAGKSIPQIAIERVQTLIALRSDSTNCVNENRPQETCSEVTASDGRGVVMTDSTETAAHNKVFTRKLHTAHQHQYAKQERKALHGNKSRSDIDWVEVGWSLAGLTACILIICFWDTPVVQVILIIWQIVEAIIGLVGIVLFFYGIYWIFKEFLMMMDH